MEMEDPGDVLTPDKEVLLHAIRGAITATMTMVHQGGHHIKQAPLNDYLLIDDGTAELVALVPEGLPVRALVHEVFLRRGSL